MSDQLFDQVLKAVRTGNPDVLFFPDVDPEDFACSLESLRAHANRREKYSFRIHWFSREKTLKLVMPSMLHSCVSSWVIGNTMEATHDRIISSAWYSTLSVMGCPEYDNFVGAYKGSIKTPTYAFQPRGGPSLGGFPEFPTVVVESGINEPYAELQANARLWQEGTAGAVRVVLQAQFSAPTENKMRLFLSVTRFGPDGHQMLHHFYHDIFPAPPYPQQDPYVTLDELYGGNCPPTIEPKAAIRFSLTFLRGVADHWIRKGGYLPA
ncbi:hypothetical protein HOY82DRAFT_544840 [Tuber indicum]|nr:hypothetical protein HOY82DRAFT_544840 [Tuber indicum]